MRPKWPKRACLCVHVLTNKLKSMKRLLTIAILLISINSMAQQKPKDQAVKDTVIRSVSYTIYQGARGGKYYFKTSKSGTIYKVYLKK